LVSAVFEERAKKSKGMRTYVGMTSGLFRTENTIRIGGRVRPASYVQRK